MIAAIKLAAQPYILWLKLAAGAAILGLLWLGYHHIKQIGYNAAKVECIESAQKAQAKADERHAKQVEDANTAVAESLLDRAEFETRMKGRQNELRKVSASLANCKLSRDVVRVLESAGADADGDNRAATGTLPAALPTSWEHAP